jgi:GWxTD domain-containing protein
MIFMKRLDYVMKAFKKENSRQPWNTDRARIFLLNGNPASIEYKQTDSWAMQVSREGATGVTQERDKEDIQARTAEVWSYPYKGQLIYYVFAFSAPNKWRLAQGTFSGNRFLGALEIQSKEQTYGINDIEQYTKELENLKKIK